MSLIGTFQNLVTENYNSFFFSQSLSGRGIQQILQSDWFRQRENFLIGPAHGRRNPSLGWVSLCDDLKFPFFFYTEIRLHTEVTFH